MFTCKHVVHTLRKRGLLGSLQSALNIGEDFWFDLRHGTHTGKWIELKDLEVQGPNRVSGRGYQGTRVRHFRKIMDTLNFPDSSVFVDLGSGKGRVLLMACRFNFKRIVGVEFSHELCEEAKVNLSIYKKKTGTDPNVEIAECDVAVYEIKDDENVFFLFNSFDRFIMQRLLNNLTASLARKRRKIWLIYNNPVCRDVIEKQGIFVKLQHFNLGGSNFRVYASR